MKKKLLLLLIMLFILSGCSTPSAQAADAPLSHELSKAVIHFISTGNSDCILIQSDKNVLIDGGQNDDEKRIVEYLNQQNIKKIDYLISTHPDADHSGGLDAVVNHFVIGDTFVCNGDASTKTYQDFIHALSNKNLKPAVPLEDKQFPIGNNTYIQFYNARSLAQEANDLSLVTLLVCGDKKALFTGDASVEVENQIQNQLPTVDLLKVGHHGSKSSTSLTFLERIKPTYAVICTGENSYGHPTDKVLSNLNQCHVEVYRTDRDGNVIFTFENNEINIKKTETLNVEGTYSTNSTFIGNKNTHKFHYSSCESAKKINKTNRIYKTNRKDFINEGYNPCQNCNP